MRAKNLLLSIIAVFSAFIASAESADTCIQVQRTQEQFQKKFKEFIENTRAYMISKHIIPADSTHLLNDVQKKALQNAKIMAKRKHSKIKLPIELNEIIGESSNNKRYESRINLEDAYFINIDRREKRDCKTQIRSQPDLF